MMDLKRPSPAAALVLTVAWLVVGFLLLPMLITVPISFTPERYLSLPDGELSLRHYRTLISDPVWIGAIRDSVAVGIGAMIVAVAFGASAAIGLWQIGGSAARILGVLPMLPLIVPPIVSALALSRTALWFGMLDTYPTVILSHAIVGIPFVFMTVSAALEGVDRRIVQAARSLGAGPFQALAGVVLPNLRTGLLTGALFAFFTSWDEIVITLFVSSRNVFTLPRKIWTDLRDNIDPAVAAISALMICITLLAAAIYLCIGALRARKAS